MKIGMIHILYLSVMLFLLAGCGDGDNDNGNAMDSVIADPDFMFNTSISLNIQLESTLDEAPLGNAYFEILMLILTKVEPVFCRRERMKTAGLSMRFLLQQIKPV